MCLHIRKPRKMPVHIFRYLRAQASKQSIWFFSGVSFPNWGGAGICYLRQREAQPSCCFWQDSSFSSNGSHCSAQRWTRRWERAAHPRHPPSYAGNAFAAQPLGLALAVRHGRVLADRLSCWHSEIPLVRSTSWAWVAVHLMRGKGICTSYSHVKISCLLWNLSPLTCAV